eukprot:m.153072 g.153072  ORF g.153072 m.153072 type:complete len:130 (+) comp16224_c0_seq3:60-449(+)
MSVEVNAQLYLAWLKAACSSVEISAIQDFADGRKLLALAEDLTGFVAGAPEPGSSKIHNINNCHRALQLFKRAGVDIAAFQGEDFDSFNEKQIHSFLWLLVRQFSRVDGGRHERASRQCFLLFDTKSSL